ncbi:Hypothetical predicted protein [Lecanosticta acicola]|uniref:Uncharacterized protein n=1 Tax=Lecanosticta acicola TaxID=111012 RepID=A0AAI8Z1D2_9PEZI|nr:Hypothetical predicted protein [Lecanosticta acicola]
MTARAKELAYIFLFHGANPRWDDDQIIFTKSSLELLPADLADDTTKEPRVEAQDSVPPGREIDEKSNDQASPVVAKPEPGGNKQRDPIAVFKQRERSPFFKFEGSYQIDRLTFLEPKSPGFARMLEHKWTKQDPRGRIKPVQRSGLRREESVSYRWAVITLKKDEVAEKEAGAPKVEKNPDVVPAELKTAKKSVNDGRCRRR